MLTTGLLPTYKRTRQSFDEAFGVPVRTVLRSMDEARDDVAEHTPQGRPLALREVGCVREHVVLHIRDPFGSALTIPAMCRVRVSTAVPANRRGLHMSRIGDALAHLAQEAYRDPAEFAALLADAIDRAQYGGPTVVTVTATVAYVEEVPLEGRGRPKSSLEHLDLAVTYRSGPNPTADASVRVSHIVACPCVQQTRRHALLTSGARGGDEGPGFTHSQRCKTTVTVRGVREWLPVPRVLGALDAVLFRTINTLPRGSELLLVHRAHQSPQFVEDAVRGAVWAMYGALGTISFTSIEARSRSIESIHEFDLSARASLTAEDARVISTGE